MTDAGSVPPSRRPALGVGAIVLRPGPRGPDVPEVLLIRRGRAPAAGSWSLPGGHVEGGESLARAVRREVLEETGVAIEPLGLVEVIEIVGGREPPRDDAEAADWLDERAAREGGHYVVLDYVARPVGGELRAGADELDAAWATVDALDAYALTPAALRVIAKARAMLAVTGPPGL